MKRCLLFAALLFSPQVTLAQVKSVPAKAKLEYARDILPILSANCFTCHGPDEKNRKAGLRLDLAEEALKPTRSGLKAIVPGDVKASELIARIHMEGSRRMPPARTQKSLKPAEKELLAHWIEQGAPYQKHWAFLAPVRPSLPRVKTPGWARQPFDLFLFARLERQGLKPAVEADRYTLARRVCLDLTGLPPTLDMADRFVNDKSPDAYERYVDEVLAMPAFGEHWAHVWLDLARYADSNGYATDKLRSIWKYRDWVVGALNQNMPFDRFTTLQLAGDLLPESSAEQILATAFHRNTLTNDEGGTNDEEFRVAAVVDRVNTTMQVWMGITMGCAQCHDHKYDPITQKEYFRMYAIFNQTEDADRGDDGPLLSEMPAELGAKKKALEAKLGRLRKELEAPDEDLDAAQARWELDPKPGKLPAPIQKILALEPAKRTPAQNRELTKHFRSVAPELKELREEIAGVQKQIDQIKPVTTPILRELAKDKRRTTRIQVRGNFLDLAEEVQPGVPAIFHNLPAGQQPDRLALARWLVDPRNPLTSRVAVNRFWEQIFGVGLLETPDDFGTRGKLPIHPELLDWLAVEFMSPADKRAPAWDVKRLLRMIVTSATYRQSSKVTPELWERDPDNRLFARGPRFRSSAEVIRDQALFVSGLLSDKMFGPPVRPYQPKLGLTAAFGGGTDWTESDGADKHRRALYTQWRRTTPYPSMATFDAPSRNVCTVKRPRTNTPLQALVTLNDPCYVEAAQALARRILAAELKSVEDRAQFGFRLCLIRPPHEEEVRALLELFHKSRADFAASPKDAQAFATEPIGLPPPGMDVVDLAAWTVVGNVLLNLDEMFAKR